MAIASVKVIGLFGYFDHEIPLKMKDRITIIHGANGVGKTTILRLLHNLFAIKLSAIRRVPFSKIIVSFSPKGTLTVFRDSTDEKELPHLRLIYRSGKEKVECSVEEITEKNLRRRIPIGVIENLIDPLERVGPAEWLDQSTGDVLTLEEILFKYGDFFPEDLRLFTTAIPEKLQRVLNETNVYLIETQRLFIKSPQEAYKARHRRVESRERMTVEEYSDDLVNNVQSRLRESGTLSASLDRDFPRRLLETPLPTEATEETIRTLYAEQSRYRDRLMRAGLMKLEQQVPLPKEELEEIERKVLWIYLTDVQKKLELFDDLLLSVTVAQSEGTCFMKARI